MAKQGLSVYLCWVDTDSSSLDDNGIDDTLYLVLAVFRYNTRFSVKKCRTDNKLFL